VAGECAVLGCDEGSFDCDGDPGNGCESQLHDEASCGACGVACSIKNGKGSCASGACALASCDQGFADCDGALENGCEQSLKSATSCGACGSACPPGQTCSTGVCAPDACPPLTADCDGDAANGCETSLASLTSCGGCGVPCGFFEGKGSCDGGTCTLAACDVWHGDCDGNPENGCETSVLTSPAHCGGCGQACKLDQAQGLCLAGVCHVTVCLPGFGSCNGDSTDGCETSLTSADDCGQCGVSCGEHGACEQGECACEPGFARCGETCVDLQGDADNCGSCGNSCQLGAICADGSCACPTGSQPCGQACTNTSSDPQNCGQCGVACQGGSACTQGQCGPTCAPGKTSCGGVCVELSTDLKNCGFCGNVCPDAPPGPGGPPGCVNGLCAMACGPGLLDCDGTPGCETSALDDKNCGACGNACSTPMAHCDGALCKPGFISVAVGIDHTCGVLFSGDVFCWGGNPFGQLGTGDPGGRSIPSLVTLPAKATRVVAGLGHTCALTGPPSEVYCWGQNNKGQLGPATEGGTSLSPLPVFGGQAPPIDEIHASESATCVRTSMGDILCWGSGENGVNGSATQQPSSTPLPIATGGTNPVPASQFAMGGQHGCLIGGQPDGTQAVFCWGSNSRGQLGVGQSSTALSFSAIALPTSAILLGAGGILAGKDHSCYFDGSAMRCWGDNTQGQFSLLATTQAALSPGSLGSVVLPSFLAFGTTSLARSSAFSSGAMGGASYAWGANQSGQLGIAAAPYSDDYAAGLHPGGGTVAVGPEHGCVIDLDGRLLCAGAGTKGQLGSGKNENSSTFQEVQSP
jgi:alpha-tubulin suppressor-like RCC1 family protein